MSFSDRIRRWVGFLAVLVLVMAPGCGPASPRFLTRDENVTRTPVAHQLDGVASYYADKFNGRTTANGEEFDMRALTAAHRTLPFNTIVRVTNLENGRSVAVRINDRGPFKDDRVIDLSLGAAQSVGMIARGTAPVRLEIVEIPSSPR